MLLGLALMRFNDGNRIVSSLVRSNAQLFTINILKWLAISVPACYCNAMLDYLQSKLALAYRTR